jgi:hypothetical protein
MKSLAVCAVAVLLLGATMISAQTDDIRKEKIQFAKGASSAIVKGTIKGYKGVDYELQAKAGQTMTAVFKPSNKSAYFNVLPPGSEEALFNGSITGNRFEGKLPSDGVYTLRVYLMRNAARRNETANYTLEVSVTGAADGTTTPRP